MLKKIIISLALITLSIGIFKTDVIKAEEDYTTNILWDDVNQAISAQDVVLNEFELKEGYSYILAYTNNLYHKSGYEGYVLFEVKSDNKKIYYLSSTSYQRFVAQSATTHTYISYRKDNGAMTAWSKQTSTQVNLMNVCRNGEGSYFDMIYSDFYIYDSDYNNVLWSPNHKTMAPPDIPFDVKLRADNIIVGKYSPMSKAYADQYFLLVGTGTPVLRWGDRAIAFSENNTYVGGMEVWHVNENNEWQQVYTDKLAWCANDKEGLGLEYTPEIYYTNKVIYHQNEGSTDLEPDTVWCQITNKYDTGTGADDNLQIPDDTEPVDKTLGLEEVTKEGFKYNGIQYYWRQLYGVIWALDLEDYTVIYDDMEKQLYFIWSADDSLMAQSNYRMINSSNVSFHFDIYTKKTNSSATDFYYSVFQILENGRCVEIIEDGFGTINDDNLRLDIGWTNPDYTIQDDMTFDDAERILPNYQDYVLTNNIIATTCDIFNESGVQIYSKFDGIKIENVTPEKIPDGVFEAIKYYIRQKLPVIQTTEVFIYKFKNVLQTMKDTDKAPDIIMKVNDFYGYTGELNVLDLSWYEPYREYVKAILSALLIVPFILWVYRKGLPDAIGGI